MILRRVVLALRTLRQRGEARYYLSQNLRRCRFPNTDAKSDKKNRMPRTFHDPPRAAVTVA